MKDLILLTACGILALVIGVYGLRVTRSLYKGKLPRDAVWDLRRYWTAIIVGIAMTVVGVALIVGELL